LYRASSIFTVPLSFGEFEAMVAPIAAYFIFHAATGRERALGIAAISFAIVGLVISGSRGGYIAFLIGMLLMIFAWGIRYMRSNPQSFIGTLMFGIFTVGAGATLSLIMVWPRLHDMVLGGWDTASSDDARFAQWDLAMPHILSNPITGHGVGTSGILAGIKMANGM